MSEKVVKTRLDKLLVESGLVSTIEKAFALILAGDVLVDDKPVTKAGHATRSDAKIRLRGTKDKYVSRGGDKLEGALIDLNLEVTDLICVDVGSSTGGFTDCLLQKGAKSIYAVDVGSNQLDHKLRSDPRVKVYEQTHAKDLKNIIFIQPPDLAVIDVSFIGLRKVLPFVKNILKPDALILMLVKPQFELTSESMAKSGAPLSEIDPYIAVENLKADLKDIGLEYLNEAISKVKGRKSDNQEYFVLVRCKEEVLNAHSTPDV